MLIDPAGTSHITRAIIGCGIQVHDALGPGLFESVYMECMQQELRVRGLAFETGRKVPVIYKGVRLKSCFYVDIIVENRVIVELKSVAALMEVHRRQVLTQLKLTGLPVGLLLNFNVVTLTDGGVRRVGNAPPQPEDDQ